jgi:FMN phosphatase YigB (HAD superfamily)
MNTVLFDLDGTLLPLDMDIFMKIYFRELAVYFSDLIDGAELAKHIMSSTDAMINNMEPISNEKVFMDDFSHRIKADIGIFKARFDTFYDTAFQRVKASTSETPFIRMSIELLNEKGYQAAVATNPIFPLKAVHHRLRWAGLDPEAFIYISSYEQNHFCKPYIEFYREVLAQIGKRPEECLMVGNDVQEDIIAGKLGIRTYLIRDCMIHRTEDEITADHQGSYEDFYKFVQGLPEAKAYIND